jgi:hypothetical protein
MNKRKSRIPIATISIVDSLDDSDVQRFANKKIL